MQNSSHNLNISGLNEENINSVIAPPEKVGLRTRIETFVRRVVAVAMHRLLNVYYLEGDYGGERMSIVVADDGNTLDYVNKLAFKGEAEITPKGKISALKAVKLINSKADLVVVGINYFLRECFRRGGYIIVPTWVCLQLPLCGPPEEMLRKLTLSARKDIKHNLHATEAKGYTYGITTDSEWLDSFYYNMYRPYALNKFGDSAVVYSYKRVKKRYQNGFGLVMKKDGKDVAASILIPHGKTLYNQLLGVLNGDTAITRDGAVSSMYYYTLLEAYQRGFEAVNFGYSRPFLSDGALRFKLKWSMQLSEIPHSVYYLALAAPEKSPLARRFVEDNHFFYHHKDGLRFFEGLV